MDAQELFKEIEKAQETFGKNRYACQAQLGCKSVPKHRLGTRARKF
jgi:hypothetical protein